MSRRATAWALAAVIAAAVIAAVAQQWYVYVPSADLDGLGIPTGDFDFAIVADGAPPTLHQWLTASLKVLLVVAAGAVLAGQRVRRRARALSLAGALAALLTALGVSIYVLATPSLWSAGLTWLWGATVALVALAVGRTRSDGTR